MIAEHRVNVGGPHVLVERRYRCRCGALSAEHVGQDQRDQPRLVGLQQTRGHYRGKSGLDGNGSRPCRGRQLCLTLLALSATAHNVPPRSHRRSNRPLSAARRHVKSHCRERIRTQCELDSSRSPPRLPAAARGRRRGTSVPRSVPVATPNSSSKSTRPSLRRSSRGVSPQATRASARDHFRQAAH